MKAITTFFLLLHLFFITAESFASPSHENKSMNWRTGVNVNIAENETLSEELGIAGINVDIEGKAEQQLKVVAVRTKTTGVFEKEIMIAAADAELGGTFLDTLTCYAANARLSGTFDGDVLLKAARIVLDSTAVINGNLDYSTESIEGLEKATIHGAVTKNPFEAPEKKWGEWNEKIGEAAAATAIAAWFLSLAAILITGIVIHALFSRQMRAVVETIDGSPWADIGVGFVVLAAAPPAIALCFSTLVGIPLALIAGMLFLIALFISQIFSGLWLGEKITARFRRSETASFFWPFLLGILLIWLIGLIPFAGWLAGFIFLLLGLGALWLTLYRSMQSNRA